MKSLYAQYIKEREDYETIETSFGFASFKIENEDCYIRDIYVHPDYRKDHAASILADQVVVLAKKQGCRRLLGSVCPETNGSTTSLKVLLSYGFQLLKAEDNFISFSKEI